MTKNVDVFSSDLMTIRYLTKSMNDSGENGRDEELQRRDAPWNLTNGEMRRDGYNASWRRESERNMARTRNMTMAEFMEELKKLDC